MYMNRQIEGEAVAAVLSVRSADDLHSIHRADLAAVLWQRAVEPGFQDSIDRLDPAVLPSARIVLAPGDVPTKLRAIFDAAGTPDCMQRRHFIEDIAELARVFASVMAVPHLRLRLDVVTNNACRRFHIDAVTARLICTYRGQGTQYGVSLDGAEPQDPAQAPKGAPMVLRGTRWPESPDAGLVHRSPPIEGTGETRLLLVLDPISDVHHEDAY